MLQEGTTDKASITWSTSGYLDIKNEEHNETLVQIVCETNRGLEASGGCERDEYCAGLNTLDDAVCGKANLCTLTLNDSLLLNTTTFLDFPSIYNKTCNITKLKETFFIIYLPLFCFCIPV